MRVTNGLVRKCHEKGGDLGGQFCLEITFVYSTDLSLVISKHLKAPSPPRLWSFDHRGKARVISLRISLRCFCRPAFDFNH